MDAQNKTHETWGLFGKQLAENIQASVPGSEAFSFSARIDLHLETSVGQKAELKNWLYRLLESLPEIEHPIERVQFVIYQSGSMDFVTVINQSKFDILAVYDAIECRLNFSSPPPAAWELEPLPLNHPYYTQKDWLQMQLEKKKPSQKIKEISFDDLKDLPNVTPLLEKMRKNGIKI